MVLVHDLRYLGEREATTRNFLLLSFFVLACGAALITVIAARFAWIDWTEGLRQALSGDAKGAFQPLMRDVRALAERLAQERERVAGVWSPARLRATLRQFLQGERIVILANREPYMHVKADGGNKVIHPASGLVTALEPVMRACSGVWVAHGSGTADRETVDIKDRVPVPPGEESYLLRRVWLTEEEENGYYYGFSNEGLWPLCHVAHARPVFRAEDWEHYVRGEPQVRRRGVRGGRLATIRSCWSRTTTSRSRPRMIRETLPRATIITFWHIPWPNAERIGICPWREELISGPARLERGRLPHAAALQQLHRLGRRLHGEPHRSRGDTRSSRAARRTLVRPYPISIEWPVRWLDDACRRSAECRASTCGASSAWRRDALLGVGVDRLDYTKGIEERLSAVGELLRAPPRVPRPLHLRCSWRRRAAPRSIATAS